MFEREIIINLNFSALSNLGWWLVVSLVVKPLVTLIEVLYTSINVVSAHRPALFILSGLGVGFGLGLVVFQRPMASLASPLPALSMAQLGVVVKEIQLGSLSYTVTSSEESREGRAAIRHLATSGSLGQNNSLVLEVPVTHEAQSALKSMTLNQQVSLLGSNNGRYSYRVVEIKEVDNEMLPTLFNPTGKSLVLYTPVNLIQTKYLVIIAK